MGRKVIYWVVNRFAGAVGSLCRGQLLVEQSASNPRIRARGIPAATARSTEGFAKLLGGITLIVPGLTLKEWAYAGFTFAWIAAVIAHYLAKDGAVAFFLLILLVLLFVSYFTRPGSRRLGPKAGIQNDQSIN